MKKREIYISETGLIFLCLFSSFLTVLLPNLSNKFNLGDSTDFPSSSTAAGSNNTYPAANAQLYANSPYNFTAEVRDETSLNRSFDSANMLIEKEGSTYSNTSLIPLGTYNATYSFDSDRAGGLAVGFTYAGTGTSTIATSYLGHQQVLDVKQTNAAWYYATTTFATGFKTFSVWACPISYTTGNQWELIRVSDSAIMAIVKFQVGNYIYAYNGNVTRTTGVPCAANRWYFIQVICNFVNKSYDVYVDGALTSYIDLYTTTGTMEVTGSRLAVNQGETYYDALNVSSSGTAYYPPYVYPATDSFTGSAVGGNPAWWYINDVADVTVQTEATRHNSMQLYSHEAADTKTANLTFPIAGSGVYNYSFWVKCSGTGTQDMWLNIRDSTGTSTAVLIHFDYVAFNIYVYNGVTATNVRAYAIDTWYYFSIYISKATGKFNLDIDLVREATDFSWYAAGSYDPRDIYFQCAAGNHERRLWIDAVDVSTDPTFYYKRNYVAGGTIAAVMGATPADLGQVGIYNAAHSFESDTTMTVPAGWTDASAGPLCRAFVAPQTPTAASGHRNVLLIEDQTASYQVDVKRPISPVLTATTSAYAEFWFFSSDVTKETHVAFFYLNSGLSTYATRIYVITSNLYSYSASAVQLIQAISSNTWYHVRVLFNFLTYKYAVWVNGILKQTDMAFQNNVDIIGYFRSASGTAAVTGYYYALDGIDFSSSAGYSLERSTYMFLNSTQTFPTPGAYASKWQAWSAGINYDQASVPFVVNNNVQYISESDSETRWVLTDYSQGSWTNLYTANFGSEAWTISQSPTFLYSSPVGGDATIKNGTFSSTNYGGYPTVIASNGTILGSGYSHALLAFNNTLPYLTDNVNSTAIYAYRSSSSAGDPSYLHVCNTTSFDESTVTWNTRPTTGGQVGFYLVSGSGWETVPISGTQWDQKYYELWVEEEILYSKSASFNINSKEYGIPANMIYEISKMYNTTGRISVQTNATETLTLSSPTIPTINLQTNDRIRVTFNTTNTNEVQLLLYNGANVVRTFSGDSALIEQGNLNFATQTKTFAITAPVSMNDLRLSGTFDNVKNLQITTIVIEHPTFQNWQYYLNPQGMFYFSFQTGTFGLTIYSSSGTILQDMNATLSSYALNCFTYSPTTGGERQVNFYDQSGNSLSFATFRTVLNRTINGINSPINPDSPYYMTGNRFYADIGSYYNISVKDRFGQTVYAPPPNQAIETFIDITVDMYSVVIQNLMKLPTLLTLTSAGTSDSQYITVGSTIEYTLLAGTYQLNYTQSEMGTYISANLTVSSAMLYTLNTSYYSVYFSAFSNDLLGLPEDSVRLYIDGVRKSWGPVELLGLLHTVNVTSYFNDNVFGNVFDGTPGNNLAAIAEYNVFVNMATLVIQDIDIYYALNVSISKNGVTLLNQTVDPQTSLSFRFLAGSPYRIDCMYVNGTVETRYVSLTANGTDLVSFGVLPAIMYTVNIVPVDSQGVGLPLTEFVLRDYNTTIQISWGMNTFNVLAVTVGAYDWFGNLVSLPTTFNLSVSLNCLVVITTYSFKITNLMRLPTMVNWTMGGTTLSEYVMPDDTVNWNLYATTYTLDYVQEELGTPVSTSITVTGAGKYVINTSYFNIFITGYPLGYPDYTLQLNNFRLYIGGSGTEYYWGFNELLAGNYVFQVKDIFGKLVYNAMIGIVDATSQKLALDVFSFQIQNLMRNDTYIVLNSPSGYVEKWLLAGTYFELYVAVDTYNLLYTQTETNTPVSVNVLVTGATRYVMNTSYYSVFFSAFSTDGLGIPTETVRLYIDGLGNRKAWGPVEILGASHVISVLDYVGDVQYTATVDLSLYSEFNIFVNMATMVLTNQIQNESITLRIEKNNLLYLQQDLGQGDALIWRFTTGTYTLQCTYYNGTVETRYVTLAANASDFQTFGISRDPSVSLVVNPTPVSMNMFPVLLTNLLTCVVVLAIGLFFTWRVSSRSNPTRQAKIPGKINIQNQKPLPNETTNSIGVKHHVTTKRA